MKQEARPKVGTHRQILCMRRRWKRHVGKSDVCEAPLRASTPVGPVPEVHHVYWQVELHHTSSVPRSRATSATCLVRMGLLLAAGHRVRGMHHWLPPVQPLVNRLLPLIASVVVTCRVLHLGWPSSSCSIRGNEQQYCTHGYYSRAHSAQSQSASHCMWLSHRKLHARPGSTPFLALESKANDGQPLPSPPSTVLSNRTVCPQT